MARRRVSQHAGGMTTTPPEAAPGPPPGGPDHGGPRVTRDEVRDLGRLRRSASDRKVAGVAGGLARHLDIDPLVLRVTFVVLAFFGGAGLLLYGAFWLFVPDERTGEAPVPLDERSRTVALLVVGVLATFALIGDSWGVIWFPWPVAIIALVVLLVMTRKDRRGQETPYPPSAATGPAPGAQPATSPTAYATDQATGPGGPAVPSSTWAPPVVPPNPRRRGPVLFWFTLALIALGVGILGMVDVAGVSVPDPAYPALALGLIGVMLVVGSVYGRAGGLIALGLVTAVVLALATASSHWDGTVTTESPRSAAEVRSGYDFGAGEMVVDLSGVQDLENLDGRELRFEGGAGRIEIVLPEDLDVEVDAQVGGPGEVDIFGEQTGGIGSRLVRSHDGGTDVPSLAIDAELGVGEIHVTTISETDETDR